MSIFGLGDEKAVKAEDTKKSQKKANATSQNDEAKAILAKMEAKKDSGDCPFC